jgi:hypothetical protein
MASSRLAAQPPANQAVKFTPEQLDSLTAPIALYPDPLLAQVMLAATFPDQIHDAAEFVRARGTNDVDNQAWDVSVRSVAHYPTILNMMDASIDWTTDLGQGYAAQSTEMMQSVQHMRALAHAQGNLESTPQQEVVVRPSYIAIWPAQPSVVYVPVYDPRIIYIRPCYGPGFHFAFNFGIGYPIGPWLIYDWDWPSRRIYYTGWLGGGWIGRSRPIINVTYVHVTNVYVNDRYRNVVYNREVLARPSHINRVTVRGFDGQSGFHRDVAVAPAGRGGAVVRDGASRAGGSVEQGSRVAVPRPAVSTGARPSSDGWRSLPAPAPARSSNTPAARPAPQATSPSNRTDARNDPRTGARVAYPSREAERPVPVENGGGRVITGGSVRQAVPVPRSAIPAQRQEAPVQRPTVIQQRQEILAPRQAPPAQRQAAPQQQRQAAPPPSRQAAPPAQRQAAPPPQQAPTVVGNGHGKSSGPQSNRGRGGPPKA